MKKKKNGVDHKQIADAYVKSVELGVDNQMLGVSGAARKRKAANETGHSKSDIYDTEGRYEYLKKKKAASRKRKNKQRH